VAPKTVASAMRQTYNARNLNAHRQIPGEDSTPGRFLPTKPYAGTG
jgi:hypothetical protein